jgi:hypothetical protein
MNVDLLWSWVWGIVGVIFAVVVVVGALIIAFAILVGAFKAAKALIKPSPPKPAHTLPRKHFRDK